MKKKSIPLNQVLGVEVVDKRIDILRRVGLAGSISEAARSAGVSYKAAWQALETLANLAGTPLVEKVVGGSGGGGAALTDAGWRVLQAAEELALAKRAILDRIAADGTATRAASALRTSMRNQFSCVVGKVRAQAGQVRVELLLADGTTIHARITRESTDLLEIKSGIEVLTLCKATSVIVRRDMPDSGNVARGIVVRSARTKHMAEVSVQLSGGVTLVGFASEGAHLKAGEPVCVQFDESSVVIAVFD